jgi:hypothetical protein
MTTSYILISSNYRDRLQYPNPADFVIPFGTIRNVNISLPNVFGTSNPVAYSIPDYNFCWTNFESLEKKTYATRIISGTANAPIVERIINQQLLGIYVTTTSAPDFSLQQTLANGYDVLSGFVLVVTRDGQTREIIGYDPTTCQILLQSPIENFDISSPLDVKIVNPSENCISGCCDIPPTPLNIADKRIVVNGAFLDNSSTVYFDYVVFLYNITLNEIQTVRQYSTVLRTFDICDYFSCDWSVTDQYWVISRNIPMVTGTLVSLDNFIYYNSYFIDEIIPFERGIGYHVGDVCHVMTLHGVDTGVRVRVTNILFHGEIGAFDYEKISAYMFRPQQSLVFVSHANRSAVFTVVSTSLVFLGNVKDTTLSVTNPFDFVGQYFVSILASPQYTYTPENNTIHLSPNGTIPTRSIGNAPIDLLTSQNRWGATGIRRISRMTTPHQILFHVQPYDPYVILKRFDHVTRRLQSGQDLPEFFKGCLNFIVCQFSYDGVSPLNFQGSQITQSQMTCYELTVTSLILPNLVVNNTQGLLTSAYPYLFLEISNETMPSGHNRSIIYSNNPFSTRATFVCSISDVNNPRTTRFIKINSDGATQTLKFSPYDNLRFRISLPDGQTFETEQTDTLVPSDPDPRVQISAVLEIRRL